MKRTSNRATITKSAQGGLIARQAAAALERHRTRGEELLALIARRVERIKEDFYELGAALKALRDEKLYIALGYRTFDDLLAKRRPVGRSQAYKLIALVENVTREQAISLGEEKAYALARLAKATPNADSVDSILKRGIEVGSRHKRVKAMSVREIEKTRRQVEKAHTHAAPEEVAAKRAAREAQRLLRARGIPVRVRVVRQGGKWMAHLELPIEKLPLLAGKR